MYLGMNAETGRVLSDELHIKQSVKDILTTPVGTRVMRRDYGSLIGNLIDQPNDGATRLRVMSAVVMALTRWEPHIEIIGVDFAADNADLSVTIEAERTDIPGQPWTFSIPIDRRRP
ncbi:TPA: GPW/gp25 family protein [Escherichia coli]